MRVTRRAAILSATASGAALALPWVRRPDAAEPIRIMTPAGHYFMPVHFAEAQGIYAKHGISAHVVTTANPPAMLPAVVAGSLQVGATSAVQLVESWDSGLDLVAVAGGNLQVMSHPGTAVLVAADGPLHVPADFRGKKVATPGLNGSFHVLFEHWLSAAGVKPDSVQYLEAGYAQMGDLLRSGSADAALAAEPFLSTMLQGGKWRRIDYFDVPGRDHVYDAFLIASRAWTSKNKATLQALQQSWAAAAAAMNADPAAARALETKVLKISPAVLERIDLPPYRNDLTPGDLQVWIDLCREQKLISRAPAPRDLMA